MGTDGRADPVAGEVQEGSKIIATLGPASSSVEVLRAMIRAGAACFRVNFSHGDGPKLQPIIDAAREAARLEERHVALLADIQGPKLRIGSMPEGGALLVEDRPFVLTPKPIEGSDSAAHCGHANLYKDVEPGTRILLADGTIELEVSSIEGEEVHTVVRVGGRLYSNKGINLPGRHVSVETLTEKDRRDLAYIAGADIDFVAVSFVRRAADVELARELLGASKKTLLVAKLERIEAIRNLEEIFDVSDGIMVARGDLGVELPFERVPVLQKEILVRATQRGKWAIVATQMLASMVHAPRPSRAEASDVLNAVVDGADAVMLSEETAIGAYPVRAVQAMRALSQQAEHIGGRSDPLDLADERPSFASGAARAAVAAAERIGARAIVTLAGSGLTALLVSKWRPKVPIMALSSAPTTLRRLNLLRGVRPVEIVRHDDVEAQLVAADEYLLQSKVARPGDILVVAAAIPLGIGKETNTIRFHRVRG